MIKEIVIETLEITFFVAVMMIVIDLINIFSKGKLKQLLVGSNQSKQYFISSFIGAIPGCFGGFTNVSFYVHGFISFGALTSSMIASSGDEAFVLLAMVPEKAIYIFISLFILGVIGGFIADYIVKKFNVKICVNCEEFVVHKQELSLKHFVTDHVLNHIIKKHIWKIFIWTFIALLIVHLSLEYLNLERFTSQYRIAFIFLAALIGLIPESGPHLIFIKLYADGLVPFSVLLTSSIVQDGHGMLPLLAYSVEDSIKVKLFNFFFGLIIGLGLFIAGF